MFEQTVLLAHKVNLVYATCQSLYYESQIQIVRNQYTVQESSRRTLTLSACALTRVSRHRTCSVTFRRNGRVMRNVTLSRFVASARVGRTCNRLIYNLYPLSLQDYKSNSTKGRLCINTVFCRKVGQSKSQSSNLQMNTVITFAKFIRSSFYSGFN